MAAINAQEGTSTDFATRISEFLLHSQIQVKTITRRMIADCDSVLSGVLVQLGTMTVFTIFAIDFMYRVITRKPYAHRLQSLTSQGLWTGTGPDSKKSNNNPYHTNHIEMVE